MKKFISRGEWFDKGTEAKLLWMVTEEPSDRTGLFEGIRKGEVDEEICGFDEFYEVDDHES